jgi:DNA-binding winged helix-turn-helix (wHTH) protein
VSRTAIQFGEFTLDASERQLTRAGRRVALEPKTYDLLVALANHAGRLLTKQELLDMVWPESFVEDGLAVGLPVHRARHHKRGSRPAAAAQNESTAIDRRSAVREHERR